MPAALAAERRRTVRATCAATITRWARFACELPMTRRPLLCIEATDVGARKLERRRKTKEENCRSKGESCAEEKHGQVHLDDGLRGKGNSAAAMR